MTGRKYPGGLPGSLQYQPRQPSCRTWWQLRKCPAESLFRFMLLVNVLPKMFEKSDLHIRALSSDVIVDALCLHARIKD